MWIKTSKGIIGISEDKSDHAFMILRFGFAGQGHRVPRETAIMAVVRAIRKFPTHPPLCGPCSDSPFSLGPPRTETI